MKFINKVLCIMIAVLMVISIIPNNYTYAALGDSPEEPLPYDPNDTLNFPSYGKPGHVSLTKTVQWVDTVNNIAEVKMTLQGTGVRNETDVVLVIDKSGSMDEKVTINRTIEKEVEFDKEVPYNLVELKFSTTSSYQYRTSNNGSWKNSNNATANITLKAYLDDNGNYKGYESASVSNFIAGTSYRLSSSSNGTFSNWADISNTNAANALVSIFKNKTATATINGKNVTVTFPGTRQVLQSKQSSYTVKAKEWRTVTEPVTIKKIDSVKEAANKFVDILLADEMAASLNKIAVVSYSSNYQDSERVVVNSNLSNNKNNLKNAINGINALGGTAIQAGIMQAQEILSQSTASNKYIVLLSDGEPTYSFKAVTSEVEAVEINSEDVLKYNYPSNIGYKMTQFTNSLLGMGGDYNYKDHAYYKNGVYYDYDRSETHASKSDKYNVSVSTINSRGQKTTQTYTVSDNGIPTISQALLAKKSGIDIYSIGFDVTNNSNAKYVMEYTASSKDKFYLTTADLNEVFENIAGRIAKAGINAIVYGPKNMDISAGYNFNIIENDSKYEIKANPGTAKVENNSILWDFGDITQTPAIITYYVKLNVIGDTVISPNEMLKVGETSYVVYKNYRGVWVKKDFEDQNISSGEGTLNIKYYLVDKDGNLLNSDGSLPEVKLPFDKRTSIYNNNGESIGIGAKIVTSSYANSAYKDYINLSNAARDEKGNILSENIYAGSAPIYLNFPYYRDVPAESKLKNFSMYKLDVFKKPAEIGSLTTVEQMTYLFGLRFQLGSKDLVLRLSAGNGGIVDVESIKLYDKDGNQIKNTNHMSVVKDGDACVISFKDKAGIESEREYTITYNVKNNNIGNYILQVDGGTLLISEPTTVNKQLDISVISMKDIE